MGCKESKKVTEYSRQIASDKITTNWGKILDKNGF